MAARVVADSNIYLAMVINDPLEKYADALIDQWTAQGVSVAAPYLFRYGLMSVVRKHVGRRTLSPQDGRESLTWLLKRPVKLFADDQLIERGYELASRYNRPSGYDSVYLALAERLDCEFWTTDLKFFNVVSPTMSRIKWLGSFIPPNP
jgi:predicted nucleic acid-binding protein